MRPEYCTDDMLDFLCQYQESIDNRAGQSTPGIQEYITVLAAEYDLAEYQAYKIVIYWIDNSH